MTAPDIPTPVTLYFSLRSPYSWLGFRRARATVPAAGGDLRYVPIFPPPGFEPAVTSSKTRLSYAREDFERFATAYGIQVGWPESHDPEWVRPHAAFLWGQDQGRGEDLLEALYRERFGRGRDLGDDDVVADAAAAIGLDAAAARSACGDDALHQRVWQGMGSAREAGIFGVPTFVLDGERFWGNDRLEWLLRGLALKHGRAVPDLVAEPLAAPI